MIRTLEVEASVLPEKRHELEAALGVDHLTQSGVDGVAERLGSENRCCLPGDILINLY